MKRWASENRDHQMKIVKRFFGTWSLRKVICRATTSGNVQMNCSKGRLTGRDEGAVLSARHLVYGNAGRQGTTRVEKAGGNWLYLPVGLLLNPRSRLMGLSLSFRGPSSTSTTQSYSTPSHTTRSSILLFRNLPGRTLQNTDLSLFFRPRDVSITKLDKLSRQPDLPFVSLLIVEQRPHLTLTIYNCHDLLRTYWLMDADHLKVSENRESSSSVFMICCDSSRDKIYICGVLRLSRILTTDLTNINCSQNEDEFFCWLNRFQISPLGCWMLIGITAVIEFNSFGDGD